MTKKIFVFDIDGTLANCSHRQHFVQTKPKNWPAFNAGMAVDPPHEDIIWLMNTFSELGHSIIVASGRGEEDRAVTVKWLSENTTAYIDAVLMRPEADYRSDDIVKKEILDYIRKIYGDPFMVFDDRNSVVDMWRANGVRCLQVQPGDF